MNGETNCLSKGSSNLVGVECLVKGFGDFCKHWWMGGKDWELRLPID